MKISYYWFCLIFGFAGCVNSQAPSFQKIEYASFDVNSYRTEKKDSVYIGMYYTISNNGLIEINNKDDARRQHTYYSFQLTPAELKKLDSIFNKAQKLRSYLATTKMEENNFYAGSYDFFRVSYSDGTVDSLCIIAPFMTKAFDNMYSFLDSIMYVRTDRNPIKNFDIPISFTNSLKSCFLISTYLPEIINPPPFRQ